MVYMDESVNGVALLLPLLWITLSDLRRFEIPDGASVLLAGDGALSTWLLTPDLLLPHLLAALASSGLFASVLLLHRRARGMDGLGWGDVKLIFGIALWLGWDGPVRARRRARRGRDAGGAC